MIPEIDQLPKKYQELPEEYVTCRIFRWAIGYFFNECNDEEVSNVLLEK